MEPYSDPVITKYIDLVKAHTGAYKIIYQGDPTKIPNSLLPCLIVSRSQTRADNISNAQDEHKMSLVFTVVANIRGDLSTSDDSAEITKGVSTLYNLVEGRNSDLTLTDTSLLGILRSHELVDANLGLRTDLDSPTLIDYGETLRSRSPELWSIEARLEIVAEFIQTR
jgi:hypothetical protein